MRPKPQTPTSHPRSARAARGAHAQAPRGRARPAPGRHRAARPQAGLPRDRERQREDRGKQMAALKAGDKRHLPTRDRGPVRKYIRDLVDARRSVAEYFLPLALLILALTVVRHRADEAVRRRPVVGAGGADRRRLGRCSSSACAAAWPSLPDVSHRGAAALRLDAQHADPPVPAATAAHQGPGLPPTVDLTVPRSALSRPGLPRGPSVDVLSRSWTFVTSAAAA